MKKLFIKWGTYITSVVLLIGIISVNSPSTMYYYQPAVPTSMNKYKRFSNSANKH